MKDKKKFCWMKFILKQGKEQVETMENKGTEIKEVFDLSLFHL